MFIGGIDLNEKEFLNHCFPAGNNTQTSVRLANKGYTDLAKNCVNKGYLEVRKNQGEDVYHITQKGKNYRDS